MWPALHSCVSRAEVFLFRKVHLQNSFLVVCLGYLVSRLVPLSQLVVPQIAWTKVPLEVADHKDSLNWEHFIARCLKRMWRFPSCMHGHSDVCTLVS